MFLFSSGEIDQRGYQEKRNIECLVQGSNEGHDDSDDEVNIAAKISDYSTRETGIDRTSCIF